MRSLDLVGIRKWFFAVSGAIVVASLVLLAIPPTLRPGIEFTAGSTTLVRFDAVYYFHFKCNLRPIKDYPNLHALLQRLYDKSGIADTVHMDHIKNHYFGSHRSINPMGIVPKGPIDIV